MANRARAAARAAEKPKCIPGHDADEEAGYRGAGARRKGIGVLNLECHPERSEGPQQTARICTAMHRHAGGGPIQANGRLEWGTRTINPRKNSKFSGSSKVVR